MLFSSIDFAVFLPLVFLLYWWVGGNSISRRNWIILIASYVFYGWWDIRFLTLIAFSTALDYWIGRGLERTEVPRKRKFLLWTSLAINLGMLGFFKYYNFFLEQIDGAFSLFGYPIGYDGLDIILPVGISFYTFQTLSYSIDVYHRRMTPSNDPVAFAAYVSFFPQLVAGPIERATNLLPQFDRLLPFSKQAAFDGCRQILWGFFKKLVIADNCAEQVDRIFGSYEQLPGSTLLLGAIFFAFQIYGDFSGYSDIAIGTGRLFGFSLMQNFAFPYFSRDIAEFWRRWHISLSTWFRDYLYVPLGGSRGSMAMKVRNTFIIFLVSGFWHGANWTFIAWGAINAIFFLPLLLSRQNRTHIAIAAQGRVLPAPGELLRMSSTFLLTSLAWVFFRAPDIGTAMDYIAGMADNSLFTIPGPGNAKLPVLLLFFLATEWYGREGAHALERLVRWRWTPLRWTAYSLLLFMIGMYMHAEASPFIYFQF
jgi:alginate O-acetyltransferase complex protein AlgI